VIRRLAHLGATPGRIAKHWVWNPPSAGRPLRKRARRRRGWRHDALAPPGVRPLPGSAIPSGLTIKHPLCSSARPPCAPRAAPTGCYPCGRSPVSSRHRGSRGPAWPVPAGVLDLAADFGCLGGVTGAAGQWGLPLAEFERDLVCAHQRRPGRRPRPRPTVGDDRAQAPGGARDVRVQPGHRGGDCQDPRVSRAWIYRHLARADG